MQLARRKHSLGHNMKTLSDVSRKAHSNVLSLAGPSPGTPSPGSRFCRRTATSGRQDFRQLRHTPASRSTRLVEKRSQAGQGWKDRVQGARYAREFRARRFAGETLTNLTRAFCCQNASLTRRLGVRGKKFGDNRCGMPRRLFAALATRIPGAP